MELAVEQMTEEESFEYEIKLKNEFPIGTKVEILGTTEKGEIVGKIKKMYPCSKFYHNNQYEHSYGNINNEKMVTKNFIRFRNMYSDLTSFDSECKTCTSKNGIGCTGLCISENIMSNNGEKHIHVCAYNIKFSKCCNNMIKKLKNNKEFSKKITSYTNEEMSIYKDNFIYFIENGGE